MLTRTPTTDLIEQSVLGGLLVDSGYLPEVTAIISPEDFLSDTHRTVFQAMVELYHQGEHVEPMNVADKCRSLGAKTDVASLLCRLCDYTPTTVNILAEAAMVRKESLRRKTFALGQQVLETAFQEDPEVLLRQTADQAEALLGEGGSAKGDNTMLALVELCDRVSQGQEEKVKTGLKVLDDLLGGGLRGGNLALLAARPGIGKSTVALNIADNVAAAGHPVAFVSLEMSAEELGIKRAARFSRMDGRRFQEAALTQAEWDRLVEVSSALDKRPLRAYAGAYGLPYIESVCRRIPGLKLLVIDYIGLLPTKEHYGSVYERTTAVSRELKLLAKRLNVPVLALCQLNRSSANENRRPRPSDLRDSGSLEQDADLIFLLSANDLDDVADVPLGAGAEALILDVAKNRQGPTGRILLGFHKATSAVFDLGTVDSRGEITFRP